MASPLIRIRAGRAVSGRPEFIYFDLSTASNFSRETLTTLKDTDLSVVMAIRLWPTAFLPSRYRWHVYSFPCVVQWKRTALEADRLLIRINTFDLFEYPPLLFMNARAQFFIVASIASNYEA
jgi:hypothetical protein